MKSLLNNQKAAKKFFWLSAGIASIGTVVFILYSFAQWIEQLTGYTVYELTFLLFLIASAAFAATVGYLVAIEVVSHLKWTLMEPKSGRR